MRHRFLIAALVALIVAFGVSCSNSSEETPAPSPTPTPTPVPFDPIATIERSGEVMQGLSSFRFQLRHEGGGTQLLEGMDILEAEGGVVSPDRVSLSFSGSFRKTFAIKSELVTIGESSYLRNPLTTEWEAAATGVSPLGFFNPALGISTMMSRVESVHVLEDGGGTADVYRLGASVDAEALTSLLGPTLEGVLVDVELTIDVDDLYLLEARVKGRVTSTDEDEIVRTVTMSDFNEPITIEPPI